MFNGTNLTPSSDVDQDIFGKGAEQKKIQPSREPQGQSFLAGDHKAANNRQRQQNEYEHKTLLIKMIHNRSTAFELSGPKYESVYNLALDLVYLFARNFPQLIHELSPSTYKSRLYAQFLRISLKGAVIETHSETLEERHIAQTDQL